MHRLASLLFALTAVGCAVSEGADDPIDESFVTDGKGDAAGIQEGTPEAQGVLQLVNYANLDRLRETGISASALRNIDAHLRGADKLAWTSDDDSFTTLKELDDVKYVGKATFEALLEYAQDAGFVSPLPSTPCGDTLTSVQRLRDLSNGFADELFGGAVWFRTRMCQDTNCGEWSTQLKVGEPEDTWLEFGPPLVGDAPGTMQITPTFHRGYKVQVDATHFVDAMSDITWGLNVETTPVKLVYTFGAINTRVDGQPAMAQFTFSGAALTDSCLNTHGNIEYDLGNNERLEDEYTFLAHW